MTSPTPWKVKKPEGSMLEDVIDSNGKAVPLYDNKELIVKCVNAHEKLVEHLKEMVRVFSCVCESEPDGKTEKDCPWCKAEELLKEIGEV